MRTLLREMSSLYRVCSIALLAFSFIATTVSAQTLKLTDTGKDKDRRITIEGAHYRLVINPTFGGRIDSFISKPSNIDLTRTSAKDVQGGLLADGVWQQSFWHGDWNDQPYSAKVVTNTPQHIAVQLSCAGENWEDLTISKTIHAKADSAQVRVEYEMTADVLINERAKPDFYFTQAMAKRGKVFAVSPTGVQEMSRRPQDESWIFEPTRDWIAWLPNDGGPGLAVHTDFAHLRSIRATHGDVDTLEFILRKWHMTPDTPLKTWVTFEAIDGIKSLVDDAAKQPVVQPISDQRAEAGDSPTWSRYNPKDMDFSSSAVKTPHRAWAKRWAGGRPRVLALVPAHYERQAVELAQRFDMDLTCSFIGTKAHGKVSTYYILGDRVRSLKLEEMHEHLRKVLDREYDVILTGYYSGWSELPDWAQQQVIDKVKAGTGLVLTARGEAPDNLAEYMPFDFTGYDRAHGKLLANEEASIPIAKALPYSVMPKNQRSNGQRMKEGMEDQMLIYNDGHGSYPYAVWTNIGKGRCTISTLGCPILPTRFKQIDPPAFDYHEYQMALIARFIYWTANKQSTVSLLQIDPTEKTINITVDATEAGNATIELTLRDEFGDIVSTLTKQHAIPAGNSTISLTPDRVGIERCLLADVIIRNDKGTLAFGAGVFPQTSATTFNTFELDKEHYQPTENAKINMTFNGLVPLESSIRLTLLDGAGRSVEKKEVDGFDRVTAELPLERVIGPWFAVRGEYIMNGVVVDQTFVEGLTLWRHDPRQMHTSFWSWGLEGPEFLTEEGFKQFIKSGMNANFGARSDTVVRSMNRLNMPYSLPTAGLYANRGTTKAQRAESQDPEKKLPVYVAANPEAVKTQFEKAAQSAERTKTVNALIFSLGDENRGPPRDIGFSDVPLNSFRTWLREHAFESLDALNSAWQTQFKSWDDVMPMTEEEIKTHGEKTGRYGPWADHRMYIKWAYAQFGKATADGVLSVVPDAVVGPSGDQNTAVYGGRDWWHHARSFTGQAGYSGTQVIESQSFNPTMIYRPWAGYSKPNPLTRAQAWRTLKWNSHGFHIFSAKNHIHPDYTLPECGRDLRATMLQLTRGPGQLLVGSQLANDGVYILQSPQSIHTAHITGNGDAQSRSRSGIEDMLDDMAVSYRAISYEQLASGHLKDTDARMLILPFTPAMSDEEVDAVKAFIKAGGIVVGEGEIATYTEHAQKRTTDALSELKNNERFIRFDPPIFGEYLSMRAKLNEPESQARFNVIQEQMRNTLQKADVTPAFTVRHPDGSFAHWVWSGVKEQGANRYCLFIRDYTSIQHDTANQHAAIQFDRKSHVYDVIDGAYLGERDQIDVTMSNNTLRLFALLPKQVGELELKARNSWRTGRTFTFDAMLANATEMHLLHMDVINPDGKPVRVYTTNTPAPNGKATLTIPFAHNDPTGDWSIHVTDVASGSRSTLKLTLR